MAGTSSEVQRHANEPTGALLIMLEHDRRMVAKEKEAKKKQQEEEREMRKRSEELARMTPAYKKPVMDEADMREEAVRVLQAKLAKIRRKNKKAAKEAKLKQRALLDSQGKTAKKKKKKEAKNEEAGKAQPCEAEAGKAEESATQAGKAEESATQAEKAEESVTQAGIAEASVTQTGKAAASVAQAGKAEESVADMSSAGADSFIGEDEEAEKELRKKLEAYKNRSGYILLPPDCSRKGSMDLTRMFQRDLWNERIAMAKRRDERNKALIESLQKSIEKEEKKNQKKAKAKEKDEEAGKAEACVTETLTEDGKPEEAELEQRALLDSQEELANKKGEKAEKAEPSVPEAEKPEESVAQAGKPEMAGTSSEVQRHANEPTGALLIMLEHDRRMVAKEKEAKKKQQEEEREMRKRSEELARMTPAYKKPVMDEADMREEAVRVLQAKLAKIRRKNKKAAEEAKLKQRALLDSQGKTAKKKKKKKKKKKEAKNEEAGKAQPCEAEAGKAEESATQAGKAEKSATQAEKAEESVTQAGIAEAYVTQTGKAAASVAQAGKAEESVADMSSAGADSFIGEDEEAEKELRKKLEAYKTRSGYILLPRDCSRKESMDLTRMFQRDLWNERIAMAKRRDERNKALIESLQKSIEKEEKKNQKNQTKAKAKAKEKDEEAGKAEACVTETLTEAGKSEEAELEQRALLDSQEKLANKKIANDEEAEARKAEAYLTEAEKSVTKPSNAAAKTSDASNVHQDVRVFEDAEDFGSKFQSFWDRLFIHFCAYDETTTIPAMCYTHSSDAELRTRDTLQVISVKVASIEEGLRWPLQVFGTVSARDVVDRKRNIIFHRERDNCQTITEQDPYLTLTGPSRAVVVCYDPSYIEVVLKVKGTTESEDKELSRLAVAYRLSCLINGLYPCELSTLELTFSQVFSSVEATIHVKVSGGSWPDGFKGMFSAATARTECAKVKLLDVGDNGLPVDAADGMIRLSRRVVSVELRGMLKVFVSACSAAGDEEEHCQVSFVPQKSGVSSGVELKIGSCRMEASVAWSLFCRGY